MNDKMDWMKKQISELIPFKLKSMNLETNLCRMEKENKILNEKLQLSELDRSTLKGVLIEKNESILVLITILSSKEYILKFCVNIRSEI
jgi:hypothetical protein